MPLPLSGHVSTVQHLRGALPGRQEVPRRVPGTYEAVRGEGCQAPFAGCPETLRPVSPLRPQRHSTSDAPQKAAPYSRKVPGAEVPATFGSALPHPLLLPEPSLTFRLDRVSGSRSGPPLDVERLLGKRARGMPDLGRKGRMGGWRLHPRLGDGPRLVQDRVVGPERRVDGPGYPVERDVGEERVEVDCAFEVAIVIGPDVELLGNPGRESGRRVGQRVRQRCGLVPCMRLCPSPRSASAAAPPGRRGARPSSPVGTEIGT